MNVVLELLKAILYGIVEGITEWLPISSTGHLILVEDWLPFAFSSDPVFIDEFWEMFGVVIQLGAILAVVVLYWSKLVPFGKSKTETEKRNTWRLWGRVLIASSPAALVGVVGDKILEKATGKDIDGWAYNSIVVAAALIVYGVAFDFFNVSGSLFVDKETDSNIRSSAQGLFIMMTNGVGATIGTLAAQQVINHFVGDSSGVARMEGWSESWLIFAGYALVVAVLFALVFKYKHEPEKA